MDQPYGEITYFEMREFELDNSKKEVAFKSNERVKVNFDLDDELDNAEATFVRILKRGTRKYKGKLLFKCFNCGIIGHYASKCTSK